MASFSLVIFPYYFQLLKQIPFISLGHQHAEIKTQILEAITQAYDRNWFILGKELEAFEREYALFSNSTHCIGVGNGLDALFIALKACGIGNGDEVIVPSHTFVATWLAVARTGAKIVPVEPDPVTFNMAVGNLQSATNSKTRAIIPVHLYGQPCDMSFVSDARRREILVVEDNAQAHGATWNDKVTGAVGDISATSFYPVKNLGAIGDGGAIVTNNDQLGQYVRRYRNYGFAEKNVTDIQGVNSRLDEIQAAVLRIKLRYLQQWNAERIKLAQLYVEELSGIPGIQLPVTIPNATHVYHLFVIKTSKRDELRTYLSSKQIETGIHYPVPPHLQKSFRELGFKKGDFPVAEEIADTSLSLPLWPGMEPGAVSYVCETIRKFFQG
jgi:dTDP-4-amino-4,6-dideoxygalactose transaminase